MEVSFEIIGFLRYILQEPKDVLDKILHPDNIEDV